MSKFKSTANLLFLSILIHLLSSSASDDQIKKHKILCIGDSITVSYGASDESMTYPSRLEAMLNDPEKYEVINLGINKRRIMKDVVYSYWDEQYYQDALRSSANTIILMLGTNDIYDADE